MKTRSFTFNSLAHTLNKSIFLFILSLAFTSANAFAQQQSTDQSTSAQSKIYLGVGLSTASYMLEYGKGRGGSLEPVVMLHAGYKFNKRLNLQIGIGYDKDQVTGSQEYRAHEDDEHLTYGSVSNTTKGLITPISLQFTPFNPDKKLRLYGLATFAPILGSNHLLNQSTYDGVTTTRYDLKDSGMNYIFIAGLHARYKASERIDLFVDGNLFYKNLKKYSMYGDSKPKSVGIGLNYNFK
jgi:hypothetical protein